MVPVSMSLPSDVVVALVQDLVVVDCLEKLEEIVELE